MYCKHCGTYLPDGTIYCVECGSNQKAGNDPASSATPYQTQPVKTEEDKRSIGLNILAWFVPLFGFIFWGVKKKDTPIKAKSVGKTALISFIVNFVVCILTVVLIFVGTFSAIGGAMNDLDDISGDVGGYEDVYDYDFDENVYDIYEDVYGEEYTGNFDANIDEDGGSETTKVQSNKGNASVSADWTDYEVSINGVKVTLPMSYKDFAQKTGCTFKDSQDAETTLKTDYYTYVTMKDANGNNFCIDVLNESNSVKTLDECTVISIYDFERYSSGNAKIVFAGGLEIGDEITEAQLKELFGEPDDTWFSEDDEAFNYEYYEDYDTYYGTRSFEIEVDGGVIYGITLEKSA